MDVRGGLIDRLLVTRAPAPLRLRQLTPEDADAFARHVAADREHLREHLPWADLAAEPEGARDWLEAYATGRDGRVVVAGAFDGTTIVAGALLLHHDPPAAAVELGCWATAAVQGLGVARAASEVLIACASAGLAVERIAWHCTTTNSRSRALAERLGFRHEGTLRSAYVLHGVRHDLDVLSLVGAELDGFAQR
ncbi:MAG: GNAT family N-acetyltransferase [Solirubrobacteraceae bacterium]